MLGKIFSEKRVLICTFVALASGLFGSYLGGQISWLARTEKCRNQPELFENVCGLLQTPDAVGKGTAGAWTGTILGAFFAGLATRDTEKDSKSENPFSPKKHKHYPTLEELTPDEIATLRRILRSLLESEKKSSSHQPTVPPKPSSNCSDNCSESSSTPISVTQFIDWIHLLGQQSETSPILNQNQAREILIYLGFSQKDIDIAWQQLNHKK